MKARDKIEKLLNEAYEIAEAEVIRLAQEHLAEHPELDEFVIAMGTCFFTMKEQVVRDNPAGGDWANDNTIDVEFDSELFNFIADYDNTFGLSGMGIKFRLGGEIVRDW